MKSALEFIKESSFKYDTESKQKILLQYFNIENNFHYENNILYRKIVDAQFNGQNYFNNLNEIPFLPVQYFKEPGKDLTTSKKIHRRLYSSATSGVPSIINIDNETSKRQIYSLTSTLSNFIGKSRREFLISDIVPNISSSEISARNSAVSGFINFSSKTHYIFNYKNNIFSPNISQIKKVIENSDSSLVICGFTFLLYKYRTMYMNSEEITGPVWAEKNDPRITNTGKIFRRYHIDEIPQLFNVLKGDMSMVGPRPERPHFVQNLIKEIPYYSHRMKVKPGVTGWAQILGTYDTSIEDVNKKLKLDFYYIENILKGALATGNWGMKTNNNNGKKNKQRKKEKQTKN